MANNNYEYRAYNMTTISLVIISIVWQVLDPRELWVSIGILLIDPIVAMYYREHTCILTLLLWRLATYIAVMYAGLFRDSPTVSLVMVNGLILDPIIIMTECMYENTRIVRIFTVGMSIYHMVSFLTFLTISSILINVYIGIV